MSHTEIVLYTFITLAVIGAGTLARGAWRALFPS